MQADTYNLDRQTDRPTDRQTDRQTVNNSALFWYIFLENKKLF